MIFESQLKNELSKNDIKPIYVLFGEDSYLTKHYENLIIDKTCGKDNDFDFQKFERDIDLQAVYDAVNQFPMLGDKKCVLVSDYDFDASGDAEFERFLKLLSESNDSSVLVFRFDAVEYNLKNSKRAKKIADTVEKNGGDVVNIGCRNENELAKMLVSGAKKRGCSLDVQTAKQIVENCGSDINILAYELEKLCLYKENGIITANDINLICVKSVDASVYEYVKKLIICDIQGAISILNDLFFMKFEPIAILYVTSAAFVDMARVNSANKTGKTLKNISEDFSYGNKTFVLDKAAGNLRRINDRKLKLCMEELIETDRKLKSFAVEQKFILEQMTVNLIHIISSGETFD